jgi:hypothetical protein
MAATCAHLGLADVNDDADPIAIPFNLMAPAIALGRLGDQRRDAGLNPMRWRREAGDCFSGMVRFAGLGRLSRRLDHASTSLSPAPALIFDAPCGQV